MAPPATGETLQSRSGVALRRPRRGGRTPREASLLRLGCTDCRAAGNARPAGRCRPWRACFEPPPASLPSRVPAARTLTARARASPARPPAALSPAPWARSPPRPRARPGDRAPCSGGGVGATSRARALSARARATAGTERYPLGVLVSLETEPGPGGGGETSTTVGPLVKPGCLLRERTKRKARVKAKAKTKAKTKTRSKEKPLWGPLSLGLPSGDSGLRTRGTLGLACWLAALLLLSWLLKRTASLFKNFQNACETVLLRPNQWSVRFGTLNSLDTAPAYV